MPDSVRRLGVVLALAAMSFLAAFGLFYFLDSAAEIENKGVKLGGAIAGFAVVFAALQKTYFRQWREEREEKGQSASERIRELEEQIQDLVASKLDNFIVPEGYKAEVSSEFSFGFAYPGDWNLAKFPKHTQYCLVIDPHPNDFSRNMNIVIEDISEYKGTPSDMFQAAQKAALDALNQSALVSSEEFLFHGLMATRQVLNWRMGDHDLSTYQIISVDGSRKNAYTITFTTTQDDFLRSRQVFDNIASTFRL
jgi:hypothetical protein